MTVFVSAVILGVFSGMVYAMIALSMVVTYRISRVVNLAQAGVAFVGATVYFKMTSEWGAPILVSVGAGVLAGGVIGALLGLVNLRIVNWPRGSVMILTLTVALLLFSYAQDYLPNQLVNPDSPFGGGGFTVALAFVSAHSIGTLLTAIALTLVGSWMLRRTRAGIYIRAIYDDPDGAATLGIPLSLFVVGVWAVAGAVAGLAGILVSHRTTLDPILILFVLVWALAAATLGGLESFPIAFAGSLLLGVSQGILSGVLGGRLGAGFENLAAILFLAVAVLYTGVKRRELVDIQT